MNDTYAVSNDYQNMGHVGHKFLSSKRVLISEELIAKELKKSSNAVKIEDKPFISKMRKGYSFLQEKRFKQNETYKTPGPGAYESYIGCTTHEGETAPKWSMRFKSSVF